MNRPRGAVHNLSKLMSMIKINTTILLCAFTGLVLIACGSKKSDPAPNIGPVKTEPPTDKGWEFETKASFADEFDTDGKPSDSKWMYDTGGSGWGNNELQYYTNTENNASIKNGVLTITAKKEAMQGMNYTSSRMVSKFEHSITYGRVEVRAKLPAGRGTWPAIWMLPDDYKYGAWPKSGEIDIMEHVGYDPNNVHFSVHNSVNNAGNSKTSGRMIETALTAYHKYRVDWTPYAIRGYYDDTLVFTFVNEGKGESTWPFDQKFHLLLNVAVGGNWGGLQGVDDSVFPASMQVDYVRFYKMINK